MFIKVGNDYINETGVKRITIEETKPCIIEAIADLGDSTVVLYSYDCTHDIALAIADCLYKENIDSVKFTKSDKGAASEIKKAVYEDMHDLIEDIARAKAKGDFVYDVACFYED